MKWQNLFSRKNKAKNIINMSSALLAQRVVKVMNCALCFKGPTFLRIYVQILNIPAKKVLIFFLFLHENICGGYLLEVAHSLRCFLCIQCLMSPTDYLIMCLNPSPAELGYVLPLQTV